MAAWSIAWAASSWLSRKRFFRARGAHGQQECFSAGQFCGQMDSVRVLCVMFALEGRWPWLMVAAFFTASLMRGIAESDFRSQLEP